MESLFYNELKFHIHRLDPYFMNILNNFFQDKMIDNSKISKKCQNYLPFSILALQALLDEFIKFI